MLPLAGCAGSNNLREVIARDLPAPPAYLRPVSVAEPKAGEDMLAIAARERAGRLTANRIIRSARGQWEKLRETYRRTK
jgi:hypothetical protein